jgi:Peptidase MA superfamily
VHTPLLPWILFLLFFPILLVMPGSLLGQPLHVLEKQDLTVLYEESLEGGAKDAVELYQGAKSGVEKKLGLEVTFIPSILLIKNTERFQKMAGTELVVAFAVPEKRLMVIDYSRVSASPFSLAVTMKHELCHLLVHYHLRGQKIPRWFDEGIAQWVSEGIGEIIIEQKKSLLNEAVLSGRIIPMRGLSESFPADRETLSLAYEQSQSLVTYMIARHGLESVINILEGVKEGNTWEDAVWAALGISFLDIEDGWRAHLKKKLTWFTYVVNNLYEILFFLAALASVIGFIRAYLRKKAYMREQEENTEESNQRS